MASIKKVETQKNYKLGCKFIWEMPAQAYIVSRPSGVTSAIQLTTTILTLKCNIYAFWVMAGLIRSCLSKSCKRCRPFSLCSGRTQL